MKEFSKYNWFSKFNIPIQSFHISVYLLFSHFIYLFIYLFTYLSFSLSIFFIIYLFHYLPFSLYIYLFICLSIYLFIYPVYSEEDFIQVEFKHDDSDPEIYSGILTFCTASVIHLTWSILYNSRNWCRLHKIRKVTNQKIKYFRFVSCLIARDNVKIRKRLSMRSIVMLFGRKVDEPSTTKGGTWLIYGTL